MPDGSEATTSPSPFQQQEQRFSERQRHILEAAAELIADKGYYRATTKAIAEAAAVSEGTLYNHFKNKDDIMFSILELITENQEPVNVSEDALAIDPESFFSLHMQHHKTFWDEHKTMMQAIMSEILSNAALCQRYHQKLIAPALQTMEAQLQKRKEMGQLRDQDVPLTARVLTGLLMGLFLLQAIGDPYIDAEWSRLTELTTKILSYGLVPHTER